VVGGPVELEHLRRGDTGCDVLDPHRDVPGGGDRRRGRDADEDANKQAKHDGEHSTPHVPLPDRSCVSLTGQLRKHCRRSAALNPKVLGGPAVRIEHSYGPGTDQLNSGQVWR